MGDVLEWGDAPARGSVGDYPWPEIVAALAERPGQWARMAEFDTARAASALVGHVKRGAVSTMDPGRYGVKSRKMGEASWGVWIRDMEIPFESEPTEEG